MRNHQYRITVENITPDQSSDGGTPPSVQFHIEAQHNTFVRLDA